MTRKQFKIITNAVLTIFTVLVTICTLGVIWGPIEYWGKSLLSLIVIAVAISLLLPCTDELED